MDPIDREKSVVILNMQSLGFIDEKTDKYCARPNATEFLLELSRKFHLATVSSIKGITLKSQLFGVHLLLFVAEEEGDLQTCLSRHNLDSTNSFILDISNSDSNSDDNMRIQHVYVDEYTEINRRDTELDIHSDVCVFIQSLHDKSNIGLHIYNR